MTKTLPRKPPKSRRAARSSTAQMQPGCTALVHVREKLWKHEKQYALSDAERNELLFWFQRVHEHNPSLSYDFILYKLAELKAWEAFASVLRGSLQWLPTETEARDLQWKLLCESFRLPFIASIASVPVVDATDALPCA